MLAFTEADSLCTSQTRRDVAVSLHVANLLPDIGQVPGRYVNGSGLSRDPDRFLSQDAEISSPFSTVERLVIGIGERDPLSLVARGWLARLGRLLFGIEAPRPFADRRLEALRLLTIALRRGPVPAAALDDALAAGLTQQQIEHLSSRGK